MPLPFSLDPIIGDGRKWVPFAPLHCSSRARKEEMKMANKKWFSGDWMEKATGFFPLLFSLRLAISSSNKILSFPHLFLSLFFIADLECVPVGCQSSSLLLYNTRTGP